MDSSCLLLLLNFVQTHSSLKMRDSEIVGLSTNYRYSLVNMLVIYIAASIYFSKILFVWNVRNTRLIYWIVSLLLRDVSFSHDIRVTKLRTLVRILKLFVLEQKLIRLLNLMLWNEDPSSIFIWFTTHY